MKFSISDNKLMDIAFILWIITEFVFIHTVYSQWMLLAFFGIVLLTIVLRQRFPMSKMYLIYLIFLCACWLNIQLGYSICSIESRKLINTLCLNFLFIVCLYYYFTNKDLNNIIDLMKKSALVISFLTWIINYKMTRSILFRETGGVNANGMAILNSFIISLLIINHQYKNMKNKIILFILSFFCIISGTRKSIMIFLIIIIIFFGLKYPKKIPKYIFGGIIFILSISFLFLKIPFFYNTIGIRIEALILYLNGGFGDESLISRASFISLGIKYFKQSPILGNGINCFKLIPGAYGTYSHNNYVELLFSVGIVGTISYYMIYLYTFMRGIIAYLRTKSSSAIISIAIVITCAITDYGQVVYYDRSSLVFIMLAIAVIGKSIIEQNDNKNII